MVLVSYPGRALFPFPLCWCMEQESSVAVFCAGDGQELLAELCGMSVPGLAVTSQGAGRVVSPLAQAVHPCLGCCQGEQPLCFIVLEENW